MSSCPCRNLEFNITIYCRLDNKNTCSVYISYHLQQHPYARKPNALLTISYYVAIMCISLVLSFTFSSFFFFSLFLCRIGQENLFFEMKAYLVYTFWGRPFHGHVTVDFEYSFARRFSRSLSLSLTFSVRLFVCVYMMWCD